MKYAQIDYKTSSNSLIDYGAKLIKISITIIFIWDGWLAFEDAHVGQLEEALCRLCYPVQCQCLTETAHIVGSYLNISSSAASTA